MLKIGLTGAIGSGKTTSCKIFSLLEVPVFYADTEAKKLLLQKDILQKLKQHFGEKILTQSRIDRKKLAQIVFNDSKSLDFLNKTIHPSLFKEFENWANKQTAPYVLIEAAILYESGMDQLLDYVIDVESDTSLQIERVCHRDHVQENQVKQRLQNQMSSQERCKKAHWIIYNQEKHLLIPQVLSIHSDILQKIS